MDVAFKQYKNRSLIVFYAVVLSLTACGRIGFDKYNREDSGPLDGGETDTDVDGDADSDSDTDADTDTDTEAYCDTHLCWDVLPTGQDKCYDDSVEFPCSNITMPCNSDGSPAFCGQDALYPPNAKNLVPSAGVDGTIVTDSLTGLIWIQDQWTEPTWNDAVQYCEATLNASSWGGFSDWRLPTMHELAGIVNYSQLGRAIDATGFPSSLTTQYWSSSTVPDDISLAFQLQGTYGEFWPRDKTTFGVALCVRGEGIHESTPERFVIKDINGEEIAHDLATGLIWQRATDQKNWQESLNHCESSTYGEASDWRLPDINELVSLFNFDLTAAAGRSDFPVPGGTFAGNLWSSTPTGVETDAWIVDFENGTTGRFDKTTDLLAICVRTDTDTGSD